MAWENMEDRLKKAFTVEVSFPAGKVWVPDSKVGIDEWLTSIAETDEELKELNIPRIRFLQNRWPLEKLMELTWSGERFNKRSIWALYVHQRAYLLFSDGFEYALVAAIEPRTQPALFQAVVGKLLHNPIFVPTPPDTIHSLRPDLVVEHPAPATEVVRPPNKAPHKAGYLSKLLVGWIGAWIDLPVLGFWHEDPPDSITTSKKGQYVMKYKETYADKQREAQKKKEQELHNAQRNAQEGESANAVQKDKMEHHNRNVA